MNMLNVALVNLPQSIATTIALLIEEEYLGAYRHFQAQDMSDFFNKQCANSDIVIIYDPNISEEEITQLHIKQNIPIALITSSFSFEMERTARAFNIDRVVDEKDEDLTSLIYGFIQQYSIYQYQHALIVDDSRVDGNIVANILTNEFINNNIEHDPANVIDTLKNQLTINIVILDFEMPTINGCELMQKIKDTFIERDFIFIGLTGSRTGAIKFLYNGVDHVFMKPLDFELFSVTLRKLIFSFHQMKQEKQDIYDYKSMVSSIVKDIYDPLYVLMTLNDCLIEENNSTEQIEELKILSQKSKKKIANTFSGLLSYLEISAYLKNPVLKVNSLQAMISSQLYLGASKAKLKNVIITKAIDKSLEASSVPNQVELVITHLTQHAIGQSKPNSEIHIKLFPENYGIVFEIEDSAPLLSDDDIASFNHAVQHSEYGAKSNNHFLNLILCKKIIASYGGSMGVKKGNNGNIYYFTLPNASPSLKAVN